MSKLSRVLGLSLLVIAASCSQSSTQNPPSSEPVASSGTASSADLEKALQARIVEVRGLLEAKDYKTFLTECVDPFWLARMSVEEGATVEEAAQVLADKDMQKLGPNVLETLSKLEGATPEWRLEKRFAAFTKKRRAAFGEQWFYCDGQWRIYSPGQ